MRSIAVRAALVICLAVTGCIGHGQTTAQPVSPSRVPVGDKLMPASPTPETAAVGDLLKSGAIAPTRATTPTPVAPGESTIQSSPLSCVEQRFKGLSDGKVLPTDSCR